MPQQLVMFLVPSCSSTSPMMEKSLAPHALPPELWSYVLLKLWEGEASLQSLELAKTCVSALLAASGVCKAWYTLLERNWKSLFLSHFSEQDLKICFELQEATFWIQKFDRTATVRPAFPNTLLEESQRDNARFERNARMTTPKHFFIAKVLDPLLISLSTDKRTLSVDETIQFKVRIDNRTNTPMPVYLGWGYTREKKNHFRKGGVLRVYFPPHKICLRPMLGSGALNSQEYVDKSYVRGTNGKRNIYKTIQPRASVNYDLVATLQEASSIQQPPLQTRTVKQGHKRLKQDEVVPPATSCLHMQEYILRVPQKGECHFFLCEQKYFLSSCVTLQLST